MNTSSQSGARTFDVRIEYFSEGEPFALETFTVSVADDEDIHTVARGLADRSVYAHPQIPDLTRAITIEPIQPDDPDAPPPGSPLQVPQCPHCGSTEISRDACARWDVDSQTWDLSYVYDCQTCENCGAEGDDLANWVPADSTRPVAPGPCMEGRGGEGEGGA